MMSWFFSLFFFIYLNTKLFRSIRSKNDWKIILFQKTFALHIFAWCHHHQLIVPDRCSLWQWWWYTNCLHFFTFFTLPKTIPIWWIKFARFLDQEVFSMSMSLVPWPNDDEILFDLCTGLSLSCIGIYQQMFGQDLIYYIFNRLYWITIVHIYVPLMIINDELNWNSS